VDLFQGMSPFRQKVVALVRLQEAREGRDPLRAEKPFHTRFGEAVEGLLELGVGVRTFELEQVEIALVAIEVKAIDTVVVAAKRELRNRAVAIESELLLEI
jgi:hypothetical protein